MSTCNLDHLNEEVVNKLESQREFLPASLYEQALSYLQRNPGQDELNRLFHLLKKYDLVSSEEQETRNRDMLDLWT
ncbi:hypothetical protein [Paenibacillus sp. PL2-23]|uniref:hypothetical protein n=1 Tax=Paenibacillus sp. PL2-23 TaxID=2100729 RepID=UPI0030F9F4D5